jgi:apolipoprotein N-acyltransferase
MPFQWGGAGAHKKNHIWSQGSIALVAGALQAASNAWPAFLSLPRFSMIAGAPVWWLQLLSMAVFAGLLLRASPTQHSGRQAHLHAGLLAWIFATSWLTLTFGWTYVAMHTYGGLPAVLAALAVLCLAALLATYYALICVLFSYLAKVRRAWTALIFASLWLLAELIRGTFFTGFGWGATGYAHIDGPLSPYAPWLGVYGLSALSAFLAMAIALAFRKSPSALRLRPRPWRQSALTLLALVGLLVLPIIFQRLSEPHSASAGRLSVSLLQGNIPQDEKFEIGSGVPQALAWYAEQLHNSRSSLVIAPETAIPLLPQQLPPGYADALLKRFSSGRQAALIGIPLGDINTGYTNSVIGLKPAQPQPWRYDKHHLVPFGEFIPPFFKWFTELMSIPLGDFNRGALRQAPFEWQGQKLAASICYEDLFSEELALQFSQADQAPTVFVNVSNLAWFGQSQAMDQHLSIARMRALEFSRPFVLATNTGLTAIVNHQGQVTHRLPRDTRQVLTGEVEGRTGLTPYARWVAHFGLWPLWMLAFGVLLGAALLASRQRQRQP